MSSNNTIAKIREIISNPETYDPKKLLLKINTGSDVVFVQPNEFKNRCFELINNQISRKKLDTIQKFNVQILSVMNYLYVDGDWKFSDTVDPSTYETLCKDIAQHITYTFLDSIDSFISTECYYFTFIPKSFQLKVSQSEPKLPSVSDDLLTQDSSVAREECVKGGFHTFIVTKDDIPVEMRQDIIAHCRDLDDHELDDRLDCLIIDNNKTPKSIFDVVDSGPMKTETCKLLPFAEKVGAKRRYTLVDWSYDPKKPPSFFLNGAHHTHSTEVETPEIEEQELSEHTKELINAYNNRKKNNQVNVGRCTQILLDFIDSLVYLSDKHTLWRNLGDHEIRLKYVLKPFVKFAMLLSMHDRRAEYGRLAQIPNETLFGIVYEHYLKLLEHAKLLGMIEDKDITKSVQDHVAGWINRYLHMNNGVLSAQSIQAWNDYDFKSGKFKTVRRSRKHADSDSDDEDDDEQQNADNASKLALIGKMQRWFKATVEEWNKFVIKYIMDGITDDIHPFERMKNGDEIGIRDDKTFLDYIPKQLSAIDSRDLQIGDVVTKHGKQKKKCLATSRQFHNRTIAKWIRMFIFSQLYESQTKSETIRSIISAFIRYYIWTVKVGGKQIIYIYNVQQTQPLSQFPYNQWVIDGTKENSGFNLKSWIDCIYCLYIRTELESSAYEKHVKPLFDAVLAFHVRSPPFKTQLTALENFDADMKKVFNNIISAFEQERYVPPKQLNPTGDMFFPMINGILEFKQTELPKSEQQDGKRYNVECIFHKDNHERFMDGYTNVLWSNKYDYKCEEFRTISRMIEQIYPEPSEREYAMRIYSTVLYGGGLKDTFVILYGTGADGKTTISNAIQCMLGNEGIGQFIEMDELEQNGIPSHRKRQIQNPCGLSASMKTETILVSNKNSHDEGGNIQLKNKRFCTVQEPDPNLSNSKLNMACIKELLSGTVITGRKIYSSAESFVPNCVLTLQTNLLLGYTEDNDAVRRRICVINHRSKFTTNCNADKMETLKYVYTADGNLSYKLSTKWKYWQAMFYYLLSYAQEVLEHGWTALSDIPRPQTIKNNTDKSFVNSNGLVGWLNQHFISDDEIGDGQYTMISIHNAVEHIIKINNGLNKEGKPTILTGNKKHGWKNEIRNQLASTYIGKIYQLKEKYLQANGARFKEEPDEIITESSIEKLKEYLRKHAVENLERSNMPDRNDLYILGYRYADNDAYD